MLESESVLNPWYSSDCMVLNNQGDTTPISMISLENNRFATGHCDGVIKIWSENQKDCLKAIRGPDEYINAMVVYSNDVIISAGSNKNIRFVNISTGECSSVLNGHCSIINSLTLINGKLASAGEEIKLWDVKTARQVDSFDKDIQSLAVLKDINADKLICGRMNGTIAIWDTEKKNCVEFSEQHSKNVVSIAVLSKRLIVSAGHDRAIKIWDIQTKTCLETIWIDKTDWHNPRWFNVVRLSDNAFAFGGSSKSSAIAIYDISKTQFVYKLCRQFPASCLLVLSNGTLVSGYQGCSLATWVNPIVKNYILSLPNNVICKYGSLFTPLKENNFTLTSLDKSDADKNQLDNSDNQEQEGKCLQKT